MELLENIISALKIDTYDAANTTLIIAGRELEDYTRVRVATTNSTKEEVGIDIQYYAAVNVPTITTITVSLLPESEDAKFLRNLEDFIRVNQGWFKTIIKNNGRWVGTFSCFFRQVSDTNIDVEPEDEVFEFGAIREDLGSIAKQPPQSLSKGTSVNKPT